MRALYHLNFKRQLLNKNYARRAEKNNNKQMGSTHVNKTHSIKLITHAYDAHSVNLHHRLRHQAMLNSMGLVCICIARTASYSCCSCYRSKYVIITPTDPSVIATTDPSATAAGHATAAAAPVTIIEGTTADVADGISS